jgi:flagellar M-ring protein FliF
MKDNLTRSLDRAQQTFSGFTLGQKFVAVIGTGALLLAGFLVYQWAAKPTYTPLFSNVSAADASAITDELNAEGVPYQLGNGGSTILVPKNVVYQTRINLSGKGLPANSSSGYSILDNQSLSTSQFQEQTDFKRAMEGELDKTIEAIDGVDTAVVHLAIPQKQAFTSQQAPTTASVLVETSAGVTLNADQVRAIVNLVAASIDGLSPDNVTVADSQGNVLSAPGNSPGSLAATQDQQVAAFESNMTTDIQRMLDRVVGPGNSAVQVTADLNFDQTQTETTRYYDNPDVPPLSSSTQTETYKGPAGSSAIGGVVGPDGQMDPTATGTTGKVTYDKTSTVQDNAVTKEVETKVAAPGGVNSVHIGVVLDSASLNGIDPATVQALVTSAVGISASRGDTVEVTALPFNRAPEQAAAAELTAAKSAQQYDQYFSWAKSGGLVLLVVLMLLLAWLQARKSGKKREQATSYMVEQLRREATERAAAQQAIEAHQAAMAAIEAQTPDHNATKEMRDEIASLIERQPEDVASLLRGWLVEKGS